MLAFHCSSGTNDCFLRCRRCFGKHPLWSCTNAFFKFLEHPCYVHAYSYCQAGAQTSLQQFHYCSSSDSSGKVCRNGNDNEEATPVSRASMWWRCSSESFGENSRTLPPIPPTAAEAAASLHAYTLQQQVPLQQRLPAATPMTP